jgi:hypothetical protein
MFPAILFFANSEYLAFPIAMFDHDARLRQLPIILFLLFSEPMML